MRYYIPLRYRAICKLTYLLPYRDGSLLVYVNDSSYRDMKKYFDLYGKNYHGVICISKRDYKPFKEQYNCRRPSNMYNMSDHYLVRFRDNIRTTSPINVNKTMCYSVGTTKANLKDTIQIYLDLGRTYNG